MGLPAEVLEHYPFPLRGPITPLGNRGGFSGARLFRVDAPGGALCLRAWPADVSSARLAFIHALMRRATDAGLDYVPRVLPTVLGLTWVFSANRYWELATWMPGSAATLAPMQVPVACEALARLHLAWVEPSAQRGICPAIERRWAAYQEHCEDQDRAFHARLTAGIRASSVSASSRYFYG